MSLKDVDSHKFSKKAPIFAVLVAVAGVVLVVLCYRLTEIIIQNDMRLLMVKAEADEFRGLTEKNIDAEMRANPALFLEIIRNQAVSVRKLSNAALRGGETPMGELRAIQDEHMRSDLLGLEVLLAEILKINSPDALRVHDVLSLVGQVADSAQDISQDIARINAEDRKLLAIFQMGLLVAWTTLFAVTIFVIYRNHVSLKEKNASLRNEVRQRTDDLEAALGKITEQMRRVEKANERLILINSSVSRLQDSGGITAIANHDEVAYRRLVRDAMSLTGARYGALSIFDDGGNVQFFIAEGLSDEESKRMRNFPKGMGLLGLFFKHKESLRIKDISQDGRSCGFPEGHPTMRGLVGVPFLVGGRSRGALYLTEKEGGVEFSEDDEAVLGLYAIDIGHAIERADFLGALKERNEELLRKQAEQAELISQLKDAQAQLLQSEKMASIGQLAAGVAHEINNPIGYINSNIETMRRYIGDIFSLIDLYEKIVGERPEETESMISLARLKGSVDIDFVRRDLEDLLRESVEGIDRVQKIVQDLKDFSHAAGTEWQWVNVHKGIDSTLNVVNNEIKYKAKVVKEYGELPEIECMPHQLSQVFMNILVNAAHAIEDQGTITVRSGVEGENIWVEIIDTGKGIKPGDIEHIFEPFFTTKPVGEGTGLGLAISYNIIKKHGGRIDVRSEVGKGTCFRIWLPVKQGERVAEGGEPDASNAALAARG